ncbi:MULTISPECIES: hypothetical protein [Microcystis]|jgi:hypothetical protein|nr:MULTISPECIES: hypothetical protein [Microcystis]MDJ0526242.1 hypothetical protein [Microcystis sp. M53600_WE12]MDJ0562297.1 hypothetical protein [Microcystis sp. M53599_WE4]MDJ0604877.1 hypothetical protein [Microcystis sp. M53602_WE12]MCZ8026271.1 hypothetical protein [Microcystis sp. LE19-10.1B]MCZ8049039.1 hypothetical protein [Microcystis sp. LE19-41.2A]
MIPSQDIGEAVDSVRKTDAQDFSNLMPRPGWQQVAGLGRDCFWY